MNARKSTPRGQMTRGGNSGPAVMLMPPEIRSIFMPNPPLPNIPKVTYRRKQKWTGVSEFLVHLEKTPPPERILQPTPKSTKEKQKQQKLDSHRKALEPEIETYQREQRDCGGEFDGMNCYNTLFVGRLAYEVTERKLLREMEAFGPVKDIKIVHDTKERKSRGYAFVEYEHGEDMKRAYRAADGMRIEGRDIVVDVERGHTVPTWLPRRLGGGLGGTRLGGRDVNVTRPGRFDPSRPESMPAMPMDGMGRGGGGMMHPPPMMAPPPYGGYYGGPPIRGGPAPPPHYGGPPPLSNDRGRPGPPPQYGGPPPPQRGGDWDRGHRGGDSRDMRKRPRSRSPDQRYGGGRRR